MEPDHDARAVLRAAIGAAPQTLTTILGAALALFVLGLMVAATLMALALLAPLALPGVWRFLDFVDRLRSSLWLEALALGTGGLVVMLLHRRDVEDVTPRAAMPVALGIAALAPILAITSFERLRAPAILESSGVARVAHWPGSITTPWLLLLLGAPLFVGGALVGARLARRSLHGAAVVTVLLATACSVLTLAGWRADAPDAFPSSLPLAPLVLRSLPMCGEAKVDDRAICYGRAAYEACASTTDCRVEGLATRVKLPTVERFCPPLELAIDEAADLAYVLDDTLLVVLAYRPSDGTLVPASPRVIERRLAAPLGWRLGCALGLVIALAAFVARRRTDVDRAAVLDAIALSSALLGAVPLATWLSLTRS